MNKLTHAAHAIAKASERAFNAFTHPPKETKAEEIRRRRLERAEFLAPTYVPRWRFQITDKPTFDEQGRSLFKSSEFESAMQWAEAKATKSVDQGQVFCLYVWDLCSPSGATNPIARFRVFNGGWERD